MWAGLEMSKMVQVYKLIKGWSLEYSGVKSWRVYLEGYLRGRVCVFRGK